MENTSKTSSVKNKTTSFAKEEEQQKHQQHNKTSSSSNEGVGTTATTTTTSTPQKTSSNYQHQQQHSRTHSRTPSRPTMGFSKVASLGGTSTTSSSRQQQQQMGRGISTSSIQDLSELDQQQPQQQQQSSTSNNTNQKHHRRVSSTSSSTAAASVRAFQHLAEADRSGVARVLKLLIERDTAQLEQDSHATTRSFSSSSSSLNQSHPHKQQQHHHHASKAVRLLADAGATILSEAEQLMGGTFIRGSGGKANSNNNNNDEDEDDWITNSCQSSTCMNVYRQIQAYLIMILLFLCFGYLICGFAATIKDDPKVGVPYLIGYAALQFCTAVAEGSQGARFLANGKPISLYDGHPHAQRFLEMDEKTNWSLKQYAGARQSITLFTTTMTGAIIIPALQQFDWMLSIDPNAGLLLASHIILTVTAVQIVPQIRADSDPFYMTSPFIIASFYVFEFVALIIDCSAGGVIVNQFFLWIEEIVWSLCCCCCHTHDDDDVVEDEDESLGASELLVVDNKQSPSVVLVETNKEKETSTNEPIATTATVASTTDESCSSTNNTASSSAQVDVPASNTNTSSITTNNNNNHTNINKPLNAASLEMQTNPDTRMGETKFASLQAWPSPEIVSKIISHHSNNAAGQHHQQQQTSSANNSINSNKKNEDDDGDGDGCTTNKNNTNNDNNNRNHQNIEEEPTTASSNSHKNNINHHQNHQSNPKSLLTPAFSPPNAENHISPHIILGILKLLAVKEPPTDFQHQQSAFERSVRLLLQQV